MQKSKRSSTASDSDPVQGASEAQREVMEQLSITSDLQQEFTLQAAYFATWAFRSARAADRVRAVEERVEVSFFELYDEYRSEHADAKENECKSYVRTHKRHQELTSTLRLAQYQADVFKAAVRAFEMRRDMLMQLGAQARAEREGTDLHTAAKRATQVVRESYRGKGRRMRDEEEDD